LSNGFIRERPALAKVEDKVISDVPSVLFLCVRYAGRSQRAAAWLKADDIGHRVQQLAIELQPMAMR
jgi:hypothetical protein